MEREIGGKKPRPRLSRTYSSCGYFLACWSHGETQNAPVVLSPKLHWVVPTRPLPGLALLAACTLSQQVLHIPCISKFLVSALSLVLTPSFHYCASNVPSPCCRAFRASLWNMHGNTLRPYLTCSVSQANQHHTDDIEIYCLLMQ